MYDVTFAGFGGHPIKAWLLIPKHRSGPVPCVVEYLGYGGSQGGGISLAVAGLMDDLTAVWANQPFLCHYHRAATITDALPYSELARYLSQHSDQVERSFDTLSYLDGVNFATRANAPAHSTVGLMDAVCPPSTIYAAYNDYAAEKDIDVFQFNGHDGGGAHGVRKKIQWLHHHLG